MEKLICYHDFAFGEQVWIINKNRVYKGKILNIATITYPGTAAEKIVYQVCYFDEENTRYYAEVKQEDIFLTKEELLKNILISEE